MANRKLPDLDLTEAEKDTLGARRRRRRKSSQALAFRCRIILACTDGMTNTAVAKKLQTTNPTVGRWRQRFVGKRLDGLMDEPRPEAPRTITDEQVEDVVVRTLETKPENATHWSTRSMAAATGMTQNAIHRIWKAFALQPHRTETFKLSKDPLFVEKVRDVVGLYLDPPDRSIVLCVDEKSQVQALQRFTLTCGREERFSDCYACYPRARTVYIFS